MHANESPDEVVRLPRPSLSPLLCPCLCLCLAAAAAVWRLSAPCVSMQLCQLPSSTTCSACAATAATGINCMRYICIRYVVLHAYLFKYSSLFYAILNTQLAQLKKAELWLMELQKKTQKIIAYCFGQLNKKKRCLLFRAAELQGEMQKIVAYFFAQL